MDAFARFAFFTIARDAGFVTLAGATLMVAFSFDPALAFYIGAHVALLFALVLLFRAWRLTEDHIVATEPWRILRPEERPQGDDARRWARERLENVLLRFAKGASGVAGLLSGSALVVSLN
jgi:Ca2+/Na+ antiporter